MKPNSPHIAKPFTSTDSPSPELFESMFNLAVSRGLLIFYLIN